MYWILFATLRVLDLFFITHVVSFLNGLSFIHKLLSYLGMDVNEFWILFKLVFLIFCPAKAVLAGATRAAVNRRWTTFCSRCSSTPA